MPGLVRVPVTPPSADVLGGAIARIGFAGSSAGRKPSKMIRSYSSGLVPGPYLSGVTPYSSVSGRYDRAVSRYGSPSLTSSTVRSAAGGTMAQARSSTASMSAAAEDPSSFGARRTSMTDAGRSGSSMSSMVRLVRRCGSSFSVRESRSTPSAYTSRVRSTSSRPRFATETKAEWERPDDAVWTPSATIAWLSWARPTRRTRTGASSVPVGGFAIEASVATRISASPERAASAEASRRASPRSPASEVAVIEAIACLTRPRSEVPFATTLAVRPAETTLTLPPAGRSLRASRAMALAASSRFGETSVACIEAEVSITSTMSPARPAGRSTKGRAASSTRIRTRSSWRSSSRLRRSFCHGALASTSATSFCHSSVDGTTASSRRSLSRYMAMTTGTNSSPASASGVRNGMAGPTRRPGDGAARRTPGPPAACPSRSARTRRGAWRPGRRGPPATRRGAPCSRPAWRGQR